MKPGLFATAAALLALGLQASADTFVLHDGSKLEGRILREEGDHYVIEVQVTRSIKDEKILPKADVLRIEKEKPDLKAFAAIATLVPTPDMLDSGQYSARIQAVERFLDEHRVSEKTGAARAMLSTLKTEANEILAGGIKISGNLITAADYRANALEIDARGQENKIRELIGSSNFLAALRAFQSFERDFKGTQPYAALLPLIQKTIARYMADVQELLTGYDQRVKDREARLTRMQFENRRAAEAAIAEELAEAELQLNAEKDARIGWVTLEPFLKATLSETLSFGKQEGTRLNAAVSSPPADSGKAFREALQKINSSGETAARTTAISEARAAGVPPKYLALLETAAKR